MNFYPSALFWKVFLLLSDVYILSIKAKKVFRKRILRHEENYDRAVIERPKNPRSNPHESNMNGIHIYVIGAPTQLIHAINHSC